MIKLCKNCEFSKLLEEENKYQCRNKDSFYHKKMFTGIAHACDVFVEKQK